MEEIWLVWARRLQAIAQNGLAYSDNLYDVERYKAMRDLAAEIMCGYADVKRERILQVFENEIGYATPKLDSRAAVFQDDRVLLVRELADGCWSLPGGWIDVGESPSEGIVREVWEESGYRVTVRKLIAVYDRDKHNYPPLPQQIYKLVFLCELNGGSPTTSIETDGVGFFALDDLPDLSTTRTTAKQIVQAYEHCLNPELATYFD